MLFRSSGLWTAMINGTVRASNVYASPAQDDGNGGKLAQAEVDLVHGVVFSKPLNFWSTPYPDPLIIKAAQALDTQTQQETGQVDFAVSNREDSRKTATEVQAANQQQSLLNSVQVSLFSAFLRDVHTAVWPIVQSQALDRKSTRLNSSH